MSGILTSFSPGYSEARRRFREAAAALSWQLESLPIAASGPDGTELTIDIACSQQQPPDKVLVVSSGVHGVEGFFGSAVQTALLEHWAAHNRAAPQIRCLFLHAVNPWGFAWRRRFDENNVDQNRNFLLPGEEFAGGPQGYAALDPLLNPTSQSDSPQRLLARLLRLLGRHGLSGLRQAIAGGQYEFPRGLFFGGTAASQSQLLLAKRLPHWLAGSTHVCHLDLHTGLGRRGQCRLLLDYPATELQHRWLTDWFGADSFETTSTSGISYQIRGSFGRWCVSRKLAPHYLFAFAEFGTYSTLRLLAALRTENRLHHWAAADAAELDQARQRLVELYCPAAPRWRTQVIAHALQLAAQAEQGLLQAAGAANAEGPGALC